VNGENVRDSQQRCGRAAVHSHRELVAVNEIDRVAPEEIHQSTDAGRVDRPLEPVGFFGKTSRPEHLAHPACSVSRADGSNNVTTTPQLLGEAKYHHLRSAGAV